MTSGYFQQHEFTSATAKAPVKARAVNAVYKPATSKLTGWAHLE